MRRRTKLPSGFSGCPVLSVKSEGGHGPQPTLHMPCMPVVIPFSLGCHAVRRGCRATLVRWNGVRGLTPDLGLSFSTLDPRGWDGPFFLRCSRSCFTDFSAKEPRECGGCQGAAPEVCWNRSRRSLTAFSPTGCGAGGLRRVRCLWIEPVSCEFSRR